MRLRFLAALVAALLCPVLTSAASARGLTLGFDAGPQLTSGSPAAQATWMSQATAVGTGMVRVSINWAQIAPRVRPRGFQAADPASSAYNWASTDAAVRDLAARGVVPLITIGSAPTWAEGPHRPRYAQPGTWRPSPAAFAAFAAAAARRYDGHFPDPLHPGAMLPRVRYWQGWNEPNLDYYLSPQWTRTRHGWVATSPTVYRGMLNAFYGAVKRVDRSNVVVAAGTAPYGDWPGADRPGQERMQPVAFDRNLFCLSDNARMTPLRCPSPPHLDAIDNHPYGIGGPLWHALNAGDVAVPDVYKLSRVLHAAERSHHVLPRGPKQVWATEISWDTRPPDPQGVPVQRQARWLEQALYVLWRQGVDTVLWYQLVDSPCIPNCATTYQAGVYYRNGHAKPSATAFRFPFVTNRLDRGRVHAWGRAPEAGMVRIEVLRARRWRVIRRLHAGSHQVFQATFPLRGRAVLRAQVGRETSLTWTQG